MLVAEDNEVSRGRTDVAASTSSSMSPAGNEAHTPLSKHGALSAEADTSISLSSSKLSLLLLLLLESSCVNCHPRCDDSKLEEDGKDDIGLLRPCSDDFCKCSMLFLLDGN